MTVVEASQVRKKRYGIDQDASGVIIVDIARGSASMEAGLQVGDLIVSV
ncbi:MAG: hypothetical protein GF384_09060, partial [Elusimicrobia bacterium]|nr:hypothetical protein [Elusimicrobiota bacterium]MBD3412734.1 hypothetical protein [Elusimicrobiota bacterium]